MDELKACPFCGMSAYFGVDRVTYGHGDFGEEVFVACVGCDARVKASRLYTTTQEDQKLDATNRWNARV